ncbi:hypothetical protein JHU38_00345 [Prevotella sp. A2931]|uniref:Bacterial Pleckstrin homology domain-containing protein n=1 Tax=Prevotella illustrans TaxID=2800387 RepID=A0ABS3M252_9BACT|nr:MULTISPECIES: hypothetical protein [Prevotella]MBO1362243.1 hypothetical protein [Prevotella illustrans]PTL26486.1 hypothetical protein C3V39_05145 [Prevotella sp. oral taxon 820]
MGKSRWLLAAVAAFLLVQFLGFVALLVLIFPLAYIALRWKEKRKGKNLTIQTVYHSLAEVVEDMGEPNDTITLNAALGNELTGVILVYTDARRLIVQGRIYPFDTILDISFVNSATPYTIGEYQLLIFTKQETLRLPVGYDNEYARDLAIRLWQLVKG